jgi:hypothetical protein
MATSLFAASLVLLWATGWIRIEALHSVGPTVWSFRAAFEPSNPFWIPVIVTGVATLLCWKIRRRRFAPGHCQACGYNLTGNVSGRCPECGTRTGLDAR